MEFPFLKSRLTKVIAREIAAGGKYELVKPPIHSLNQFHFVQFRSIVSGIGEVYGLYADPSLKKAQIVSYFEFLDRKAFFEHSERLDLESSNGVASHKFRRLAIQSAKSELIERDSILAHWYTETPLLAVETPASLVAIAVDLKENGYDFRLLRTYLGLEETYVALVINRKTKGFVLGSASGRAALSGMTKATLEAVINLFFGNYGITTEVILENLKIEGCNSLENHRAYWLYHAQIPPWLELGASDETKQNHILKPKFQVIDLTSDP